MRASSRCAKPLLALLTIGCADAPVAPHDGAPPPPPIQAWAPTLGAQIRIATTNPVVGQPITVDASGSAGPQAIVTYRWTWGDGSAPASRSTARGQVHTYATAATYTIGLTVIDALGDSATTTAAVTVAATPARGLTWTPAAPAAGQLVTFALTGDSDPFGNAATATWQFAQHAGSTSGTGQSGVTVRFDSTGSRRVAVRVAFPGAPAEEHWTTVPVGAPAAPTGTVTCPDGVRAGGSVTCSATGLDPVSGTVIAGTAWAFDGGTPATSTAATPAITYAAPGAHEVRLTATNGYGVSATLRDTVAVVEPDARVAMGDNHTCAFNADTRLYCWGLRASGQVGDGYHPVVATPVPVAGSFTADTVVAGAEFSCALVSGTPWCWGSNVSGEQGLGSTTPWTVDTPAVAAGGMTLATIAVGGNSACGITPAGTAYCWGQYYPGNGTGNATATPVPVNGGHTWRGLSRGMQTACGVTTIGTAYCWGPNQKGVLGAGLDTNFTPTALSPVLVAGGHVWDHVAVGYDYACGLTTAGAAYCWGNNNYGQLGDSTLLARDVPTPVHGGRTYTQIVIGHSLYATCAIDTAGAAWCWGYNASGQLGAGTQNQRIPTAVAGGHTFQTLSGAGQTVCGVTTTGAGYCWGSGVDGRLGTGSTAMAREPVAVAGGHTWTTIAVSTSHVCGRTTAGPIYCWGTSRSGERGDGEGRQVRATPVAVDSVPFVSVGINARSNSTCARTAAGAAWCWGAETVGALGNGLPDRLEVVPVPVASALSFSDVAPGYDHACGRTGDAAAYCWGNTSYAGALGTGAMNGSAQTPAAVTGGHRFLTVGTSYAGGCGLREDLAVLCWGNGIDGKLGNGTTSSAASPVLVLGGHRARALVVGSDHSCVLTVESRLFCWGRNQNGQLGNGSSINSTTPVEFGPGRLYTQVAVGGAHTCALTVGGEVWCAGYGPAFASGGSPSTPVRVAATQTWTAVFAGGQRTCVTDTTKALFCFGTASNGAFGGKANTTQTITTLTAPAPGFRLP